MLIVDICNKRKFDASLSFKQRLSALSTLRSPFCYRVVLSFSLCLIDIKPLIPGLTDHGGNFCELLQVWGYKVEGQGVGQQEVQQVV